MASRALDTLVSTGCGLHAPAWPGRGARLNYCTGKSCGGVRGLVISRIGFTYRDLQMHFREFTCKIFRSAWSSAGSRVGGREVVAPFAAADCLARPSRRTFSGLDEFNHPFKIADTPSVPRSLSRRRKVHDRWRSTESYPGERRVALVPIVIPHLAKAGVEVVIEAGREWRPAFLTPSTRPRAGRFSRTAPKFSARRIL